MPLRGTDLHQTLTRAGLVQATTDREFSSVLPNKSPTSQVTQRTLIPKGMKPLLLRKGENV